MSWLSIVATVGAISAALSAGCWIRSASLSTPLPMAYASGPPPEVVDQIEAQSRWNFWAALTAAAAAVCQACVLWNVPPTPPV